MREAYEALRLRALRDAGKIVFSDETSSLSRAELLQRVGALARELSLHKKAIGILASNGVAWVRIPTKPAMHSNLKPATYTDLKPATVPI